MSENYQQLRAWVIETQGHFNPFLFEHYKRVFDLGYKVGFAKGWSEALYIEAVGTDPEPTPEEGNARA